MFFRCLTTVWMLILRDSAISLFRLPFTIPVSTSISLLVRLSSFSLYFEIFLFLLSSLVIRLIIFSCVSYRENNASGSGSDFCIIPKSIPTIDILGLFFLNFLISRSEEHTSELQSRPHLVCRLLLEKKKKK